MNKTWHVAVREFLATVATKGFVVGIVLPVLMIAVVVKLMPLLTKNDAPKIEGEIAVSDPTGAIVPRLETYLAPEAIAGRREAARKQLAEQVPAIEVAEKVGGDKVKLAMDSALGEVPVLHVVTVPQGESLDTTKDGLRQGEIKDGGRLAVIVVHPDAVSRKPDAAAYGNYNLFVRAKLDDRIEDEIRDGMRQALVAARIEAQGLDRAQIESLTKVPRVPSTTVTAGGEKQTNPFINIFLPMACMGLLLMTSMTGAQYLLTTTVEEKSSRVVEVLLSAVSPMQLMTGKILGQMAVGFLMLAVYAGSGLVVLALYAMLNVMNLSLLVYLGVFYVLSYFLIASFMAAVGSAVNEMREAQTLMAPAMLVIMIPWLLWFPITRDPNSAFAMACSFIPPINNYVMMLRLTTATPPPVWQVLLSIGISIVSVYVALRLAAKVFRIGLLMFGKAPNFATMLRWARMA